MDDFITYHCVGLMYFSAIGLCEIVICVLCTCGMNGGAWAGVCVRK